MNNFIQIPLDLPDVRVLKVSSSETGGWLIQVESTLKGTTCRQCGRSISHFHGHDQAIQVRHLPVFEQPVTIEYRPQRYRCEHCDNHPTTTQRLSWHEQRSPNTKPYEEWLLKMLINSTVLDVARKLNISEETVNGVIQRWQSKQVNWEEYESLDVIGIDEISLKKGHRHYVSLVTAPLSDGGVALLGVLSDRKQETVAKFLASIPAHLKQTIKWVCCDMYQGFVGAAQAELPAAKIVVDRFHVARLYRDCADTARKSELKRLKKQLSEEEYKTIKGAMWPFRKSPDQLKDDEKQLLERLFNYSPKLEVAYNLREELTDIFETDYSKSEATAAIVGWCQRVHESSIEEFNSFLITVENWLDKITNYFVERLTSGFVEGFNNRVKVLKRRCYGIFDIDRLFQRLTLDTRGYENFGFT